MQLYESVKWIGRSGLECVKKKKKKRDHSVMKVTKPLGSAESSREFLLTSEQGSLFVAVVVELLTSNNNWERLIHTPDSLLA